MIFISMLTCTIGSPGGPNKMAAANLASLSKQQKLDPVYFLRSVNLTMNIIMTRTTIMMMMVINK